MSDRPDRYRFCVQLELDLLVDADDDIAAHAEAQRQAMEYVAQQAGRLRATHLSRTPRLTGRWAAEVIQPLGADQPPAARAAHLYRLCYGYNGPQLPAGDVLRELREIWGLMNDEQRQHCYGSWSRHGVDPSSIDQPFRLPRQQFSGDWDHEAVYDGYTTGEAWNGWSVPYFTRHTLEQMAAATPNVELSWPAFGNQAILDVYMDNDKQEFDQQHTILPQLEQTVDGVLTLYRFDIGWCWQTHTEGED